MATKKLNLKQTKYLLHDILIQEVKRCGSYEIGKYIITINNKIPLTGNKRVEKFYNRNPDKRFLRNERQKRMYYQRKENGLCIRCGNKKASNGVFCFDCHNERQKWIK